MLQLPFVPGKKFYAFGKVKNVFYRTKLWDLSECPCPKSHCACPISLLSSCPWYHTFLSCPITVFFHSLPQLPSYTLSYCWFTIRVLGAWINSLLDEPKQRSISSIFPLVNCYLENDGTLGMRPDALPWPLQSLEDAPAMRGYTGFRAPCKWLCRSHFAQSTQMAP